MLTSHEQSSVLSEPMIPKYLGVAVLANSDARPFMILCGLEFRDAVMPREFSSVPHRRFHKRADAQ